MNNSRKARLWLAEDAGEVVGYILWGSGSVIRGYLGNPARLREAALVVLDGDVFYQDNYLGVLRGATFTQDAEAPAHFSRAVLARVRRLLAARYGARQGAEALVAEPAPAPS